MHAGIGTTCVGGFLLAMSSGARGQSDWSLVAPRSNTLPKGEPPASFDRRENIISPLGVSSSLNARPALLHTNKFYANLFVSYLFLGSVLRLFPPVSFVDEKRNEAFV